jgi:hypothetical protein
MLSFLAYTSSAKVVATSCTFCYTTPEELKAWGVMWRRWKAGRE